MKLRQLWSVGGIPMELVRKDIKNLRIGIYAPDGCVRVAAPLRLDESAVRSFIISRFGWIVRKRAELERRDSKPRHAFVCGEVHYFQGEPRVLEVIEQAGRPCVVCPTGTTVQMRVPPGTDRATRSHVLHGWYRGQLRTQLDLLLPRWEATLGIEVAEVRIRRMKTRWGSCNARARRIWLNLDLVRKPPQCLEYVLVHELVHFFERGHNPRFHSFMDSLLPQWRECRSQLNRFVEG